MLPVELSLQQQGSAAQLLLRVDPDLFWFRGHFPDGAILPGVAQLDWVIHYGTTLLVPGMQFAAVDNIKFQQPVMPGSTLKLTLTWQDDKGLSFQYQRVTGQTLHPASSGRIRLC
ncbi:3-hydroxyacyl-ACP dehydratase FabZ family protein [Erwinia piriflorinigrans]|uniref:(3R)-hydroxymyristoyl-[acyl-carrier-protein] dehydratase (3R)-hydroxymyristoyl ACP dehydrase n=1 Tax=Erwinia piriflorinigrans CFBP 5888 TaxID=1161919 RepID=V5Z7G4_9GAMM|nr:(3R)-hydroxymyristoyl-ACP dehydratase [Erwinia piriflorinigrans]CCG86904.1 (3R)-hydroxymyristoyl-[acyl-carrier-protein] dehydratase (3R)-hydroxymyristoyl ACP dehydrase [Erwinia piriflorinigrans CFBP 5888]